jgi:hypothetical protein
MVEKSFNDKQLCENPVNLLFVTTQVDASRLRIPQDTAGIGAFSREFPPFPSRNKPEPVGNTHGTWKQYSGRKHTVPGTVLLLVFPVTAMTPELVSFLPETPWNATVSTRKLTERQRIQTNDTHSTICFENKTPVRDNVPCIRIFSGFFRIFNPHDRIFLGFFLV